jgi:hypothetical protein
MVMATSASAAAAAALGATFAPAALSGSVLSMLRFQTVSGKPAPRRRRAMGAPMSPVPMRAIFGDVDTK